MILIDQQICDLCGTCAGVCPENVIQIGRELLTINHADCINCRRCTWVCPVHALTFQEKNKSAS